MPEFSHPLKKTHSLSPFFSLSLSHSHIQTQTLVSPIEAFSPAPNTSFSFPSPPLPTQACDVAVSDNEVRILLLPSMSLAPVCEATTSGLWYQVPSVDHPELRTDPQTALLVPAAMHFKVGDQWMTCAWHPGNDNGWASLHLLLRALCLRHKGPQSAPALLLYTEEVLIQEGAMHTGRRQCSICILEWQCER